MKQLLCDAFMHDKSGLIAVTMSLMATIGRIAAGGLQFRIKFLLLWDHPGPSRGVIAMF